jgi:hypothetical protein
MKRVLLFAALTAGIVSAQYTTFAPQTTSTNLIAGIDGKPNFQLSGTSGCAAVNGTVGKDVCTDSAGKFYVPSVTGTPATWVQIPTLPLTSAEIPNNAANTTGTAGNTTEVNGATVPASQSCVGTNGSSQIVTASCGGGGGAYAASLGPTATITETGSDVTVFSVASVPALAAGACYFIQYVVTPSTSESDETLKVDGTAVATVMSGTGVATFINSFSYCNTAGTQSSQQMMMIFAAYMQTGNSWSNNFNGLVMPTTPTSVNWATSHTISITSNATSGQTVVGRFFRITQ